MHNIMRLKNGTTVKIEKVPEVDGWYKQRYLIEGKVLIKENII